MCPVHFLIFCYVCIAEVQCRLSNSHLFEIAEGKPSVKQRWIPWRGELPPTVSSHDFSNKSVLLEPLTSADEAVYYVDFLRSYPIKQLELSGRGVQSTVTYVKVFIDDKFCEMVELHWSNVTSFHCKTPVTGRVLTIKSKKKAVLRIVKVYTCARGLTGRVCRVHCQNRTYGPSCVFPCNCWNLNETCNRVNGNCHSGCRFTNYDECDKHYLITEQPFFVNSKISHVQSFPYMRFERNRRSRNCPTLKTSSRKPYVWIKAQHKNHFYLHGVTLNLAVFQVSLPFSIVITGDGVPCFGQNYFKALLLGEYTFRCQRYNVIARDIKIEFRSHDVKKNRRLSVKICKIQALKCDPYHFGPGCSISCNCDSRDYFQKCGAMTGFCPTQICVKEAFGKNCASLNIAQSETQRINFFRDSTAPYTFRSSKYPGSYFENKTGLWVSWWAIQLNKVYPVTWMTIHVKRENMRQLRSFSVYTDMEQRIFLMTDTSRTPHWRGLGCTRYKQYTSTIEMRCPGPMRVITVVSQANIKDVSAAVEKLEAWVCSDGTFGYHCEQFCHCKERYEVCDKFTGACTSGCADGFAGLDCQVQCKPGSKTAGCWQTCNCMKGVGCGPGNVICYQGCEAGWIGVSCNISCPMDHYGFGCTEHCSPGCVHEPHRQDCDRETGVCTFGCQILQDKTPMCGLSGHEAFLTSVRKRDRQVVIVKVCNRSSQDAIDCLRTGDDDLLVDELKREQVIRTTALILGTVVATATLCFLACTVFKLCWFRVTDPTGLEQKRANLQMKKRLSEDVNQQIMREHADYHEHYLHQGILNKAVAEGDEVGVVKSKVIKGNELLRKTILQLQRNDKKKDKKVKITAPVPPRCTPLKDNTQQNANNKVAKWILNQDFDELIERRKKRLAEYSGDILKMQESTYAISTTSLGTIDIHKLYDELGVLGIP